MKISFSKCLRICSKPYVGGRQFVAINFARSVMPLQQLLDASVVDIETNHRFVTTKRGRHGQADVAEANDGKFTSRAQASTP